MATFALIRHLGWAHQGDKPVMCCLVTFRDHDMMIPGGSLILGQVDGDGVEYYEPQRISRQVKRAARLALAANDAEEERIRANETWSPSRLSHLPVSVHSSESNEVYIVAFTEDDAKEAAHTAGLRVRRGHWYGGSGGDGEYHGSTWTRLLEHQKRQDPVEA